MDDLDVAITGQWEKVWDTLVMDGQTLEMAHDQTIVPESMRRSREMGVLLDELPLLIAKKEAIGELHVQETLGEGGMGVVYLARQTTIGREVAVKMVREDKRSDAASGELLREAWITGRLEHPNIIPVHSLGLDEAGSPLFVMKRVEGVAWFDVLNGHAELPAMFTEHRDPLDAHFDIFDQVCKAIYFANERGILHRDIKPENVMLGGFGEVYVVDWGISVSMYEDGSQQLPLASQATSPAGTPAYMAPEMASGQAALLGPHTDTYILGAVLHELVTGTSRHTGADLYSVMFAAYRSAPVDYGDEIPTELADLLNKATHKECSERFQSAEELRQALSRYRLMRHSFDMTEALEPRLRRLLEIAACDAPSDLDIVEAHGVFGECRFGFSRALDVCAENQRALGGLERARAAMFDIELRERNVLAAEAIFAQLAEPDERRRAQLEAASEAMHAEQAERARLKEVGYHADIRVGQRTRGYLVLILGSVWTLGSMWTGYAVRNGMMELTHQRYVLLNVAVSAVVVSACGIVWRTIELNNINKRLLLYIFVVVAAGLSCRSMAWIKGIEPSSAVSYEVLVYSMITAAMGVFIDWRIVPASVFYLGAAFVSALVPSYAFESLALGNAVALAMIGGLWVRGELASDVTT